MFYCEVVGKLTIYKWVHIDLFFINFPQNRGIYMFRIDADCVVDATMTGGPARYINHSCDVSLSDYKKDSLGEFPHSRKSLKNDKCLEQFLLRVGSLYGILWTPSCGYTFFLVGKRLPSFLISQILVKSTKNLSSRKFLLVNYLLVSLSWQEIIHICDHSTHHHWQKRRRDGSQVTLVLGRVIWVILIRTREGTNDAIRMISYLIV